MEKNQVENQVDYFFDNNLIKNDEQNIVCNIYKEQFDLINQLPEQERYKVLYIAVYKAFYDCSKNQEKNQVDNQVDNQDDYTYISIYNSIYNSISNYSKILINLLFKTINCKNYKNWGGKRKNSGRKTTKKESEQTTPKKDKFCNEYIDLIKKEYKKVFGKAGMLTVDNLNKISELAENNPDFIDTIPETINKLKRVEFDGLRYNAKTLCWLFDEDHYEKVYSGAWDFETREEVVERLRQKELEERRKKQNELANSNGFG